MAWKILIATVDRTDKIHVPSGVEFTRQTNERSTASFTCVRDYLPAMLLQVDIYEQDGTTLRFSGLIFRRSAKVIENQLYVKITCVDWSVYLMTIVNGGYVGPQIAITSSAPSNPGQFTTAVAHGMTTGDSAFFEDHNSSLSPNNQAFVITKTGASTFTIPLNIGTGATGGTIRRVQVVSLKRVLEDLCFYYLTPLFGITLDPGQVTGPSGADKGLTWVDKTALDVLHDLSNYTGGLYQHFLSTTKVLSMRPTGSLPAPYAMSDALSRFTSMDWEESADQYATRIFLKWGGSASYPKTQTWTVNAGHISAGYLETDLSAKAAELYSVKVNGASKTIGAPGNELIWNASQHRIYAGTYVPIVGDVIEFIYVAQPPGVMIKTLGSAPYFDKIVTADHITDVISASALAQALLDRNSQIPRNLTIQTDTVGFDTEQAIAINVTRHQTNMTVDVLSHQSKIDKEKQWHYTIKAVGGIPVSSSLDYMRELKSGGSSGGGSSAGGAITIIPGTSGIVPPTPLGGARNTGVFPVSGTWVGIVNYIPFECLVTGTYRIRAEIWARNGGTGTQIRMWDETAVIDLTPISSLVTGSTVVAVTFDVALTIGHFYHLQQKNNVSNEDVFTAGATIRLM